MFNKLSAVAAAVCLAAVVASNANASFYMSVQPSAEAAPVGKSALDLYVQNDLDPVDGVNILAASITFAGNNGTSAFFAGTTNTTTGALNVDIYNMDDNSGNALDIGGSGFHIGARPKSEHVYPLYPTTLTSAEAAVGLSSFQVDYALLGAGTVPGSTGPGARVARLVFNTTTPSFTINGRFAGEVGPVGGGLTPAAPLVVVAPEPASMLVAVTAMTGVTRRRRTC